MARPTKKAADTEQVVGNLAGIGATMAEIATAIGLSVSTLRRRPKLMQAIESGRESGRTTLRRWQWKAAENGNIVMMIWLGKQLLGQSDRVQQEQVHKGGVLVVPGTLAPEDWSKAMAERADKGTDAQRAGEWLHGKFVGNSSGAAGGDGH